MQKIVKKNRRKMTCRMGLSHFQTILRSTPSSQQRVRPIMDTNGAYTTSPNPHPTTSHIAPNTNPPVARRTLLSMSSHNKPINIRSLISYATLWLCVNQHPPFISPFPYDHLVVFSHLFFVPPFLINFSFFFFPFPPPLRLHRFFPFPRFHSFPFLFTSLQISHSCFSPPGHDPPL